MSRRLPPPVKPADLPIHLRRLITAAERECPKGHARALRELTSLAVIKVPSRGIFDPAARGEPDLFGAIDAVADRHLGRTRARAAWGTAVRRARLELDARDGLERAALQVQGVSDTVYFYTGLAFGLTWMSVYRK